MGHPIRDNLKRLTKMLIEAEKKRAQYSKRFTGPKLQVMTRDEFNKLLELGRKVRDLQVRHMSVARSVVRLNEGKLGRDKRQR